MSESGTSLTAFADARGSLLVALPFDLDEVLRDWAGLRTRMARTLPEGFERDEWAYLISFLEAEHLAGVFTRTFGERRDAAPDAIALRRPRGPVAVWLPNNVSLLGPLTLILLSLTGNRLLLKGGSQSEDLAGAFLAFARSELPGGALLTHLEERVRYEIFGRSDARNAEYAATAAVRIVFGADAAAEAVEALPHPLGSSGFAFFDRRSEAWLEPAAATDAVLETLLKVFAIYGQAGCTSPRRVVLLGAGEEEARALRDRMLALWPRAIRGAPPVHVASGSILGAQLAAARGWDAERTPLGAALLATGSHELPELDAPLGLAVVGATLDEALAELPENIQTIGYALEDPSSVRWTALVARSRALRFVPLGRMHHFGPVWDGVDFWRQCFEEVELTS